MAKDQTKIKAVIREYSEGLRKIFGNQLVRVFLYGSFARGEARNDSDIDLLCVLQSPLAYDDAIQKSSMLTAKLSLKYDAVISRVFVTEEELKTRNLPFYMNVRREAVVQ